MHGPILPVYQCVIHESCMLRALPNKLSDESFSISVKYPPLEWLLPLILWICILVFMQFSLKVEP